ncbi:hypothetical protein Lesp01_07290 [Lentzea sp. NBRC 102530]|nr:hypothetical protein Lesp01_07290 [Lentzea sp. NBRC 102530]
MFRPCPVIAEEEPTPSIVLFDATFVMLGNEMVPDTRITAALDDFAAATNADAVVTVIGEALPPPVVPPPCVAQPTSPNGAAAAWGADTAPTTSATAEINAVRFPIIYPLPFQGERR